MIARANVKATEYGRATSESTPPTQTVSFLSPQCLFPTEEYDFDRVVEVESTILAEGFWRVPILVERSTLVVMDGHHRREAAIRLSFAKVPCLLVDYTMVLLETRRPEIITSPEEVIRRGLMGLPFPAKTTRHTVPEWLAVSCCVPLEFLRQ